eukprot:comp19842_c0_seq1/m.23907 comp19842_c0_seq1/g.23907  ORF comp19842_c0_seq1/g.23907 comp19842_c0_seq1/m.23907 type:complete len:574 (+) comp19842_c0_seq1:210-1931(+)
MGCNANVAGLHGTAAAIQTDSVQAINHTYNLELLLRDTLTHDGGGGQATHHRLELLVNQVGTGPRLVGECLDLVLALHALDVLDVGQHAALAVVLGKVVDGQGIAVEPSQGDELPHVAHLAQVRNEGANLGIRHAGSVPVEGRGQVVAEQLVGVDLKHALGKLLGLGHNGLGRLHPGNVGVVREEHLAVGGILGAAQHAVVALGRAGGIPVPEEVLAEQLLSQLAGLLVTEVEVLGIPLGSVLAGSLECCSHSLAKRHALGILVPLLGNLIELVSILASSSGGNQNLVKVAHILGGPNDERVVTGVDVGRQEGGSLGVRAADNNALDAHYVELEAGSHQAVDVLLDGHQHLAAHVAALLGAGSLILQMDTSSAVLDEHLGQLHDGSQTTVAGVGIGNNGAQVILEGSAQALLHGHLGPGSALAAIMEHLSLEQVVDLLGHGVHGVVGKIGAGLVGGRGSGRALPTGHVDRVEVLGHLHHLDGVQSTERPRRGAVLLVVLQDLPHLLGLLVGSIGLLHAAAERHNMLSTVGALDASKALGLEPFLHLADLGLESRHLGVDHRLAVRVGQHIDHG